MHYHPLDVLEAVRDHGAEADEEHVRVGVGEGPEPVVILLAGRVEQTQGVILVTAMILLRLASDHMFSKYFIKPDLEVDGI